MVLSGGESEGEPHSYDNASYRGFSGKFAMCNEHLIAAGSLPGGRVTRRIWPFERDFAGIVGEVTSKHKEKLLAAKKFWVQKLRARVKGSNEKVGVPSCDEQQT